MLEVDAGASPFAKESELTKVSPNVNNFRVG